MNSFSEFSSSLSDWFRIVDDWCDVHEGLGGWVGAVGAIIAVFVAWALSRAEYRRTMRENARHQAASIETIRLIIIAFDAMLSSYVRLAVAEHHGANGFLSRLEETGPIGAKSAVQALSLTELFEKIEGEKKRLTGWWG
jgi:hypothetical protein